MDNFHFMYRKTKNLKYYNGNNYFFLFCLYYPKMDFFLHPFQCPCKNISFIKFDIIIWLIGKEFGKIK